MSSVRKLGVPVLFSTITTVHGSSKSSRERGDRFLFATYSTITRLSFLSESHTTNDDAYDSLLSKPTDLRTDQELAAGLFHRTEQ